MSSEVSAISTGERRVLSRRISREKIVCPEWIRTLGLSVASRCEPRGFGLCETDSRTKGQTISRSRRRSRGSVGAGDRTFPREISRTAGGWFRGRRGPRAGLDCGRERSAGDPGLQARESRASARRPPDRGEPVARGQTRSHGCPAEEAVVVAPRGGRSASTDLEPPRRNPSPESAGAQGPSSRGGSCRSLSSDKSFSRI